MGFKVGRTFELDFAGTDLHGAIIKMRSTSIGQLLDFVSPEVETRRQEVEVQLKVLADHVVSWNLEDDNGPVPITPEGLRSLEEPVIELIGEEWMKATRGITAPLDHRSSGGAKPAEESIPMEIP